MISELLYAYKMYENLWQSRRRRILLIYYFGGDRIRNRYVEEVSETDDGCPVWKSVSAVVDGFAQRPPFLPHVLVGFFTFVMFQINEKSIQPFIVC